MKMPLADVVRVPYWVWLLIGLSLLFLRLASVRYSRGLHEFDGPFLASFTDLWRLWLAYRYPDRVIYTGLPAKYGKIIRLGPKTLVFTDPDAIKDIYATGYRKVCRLRRS
jgi:hypothetical protein